MIKKYNGFEAKTSSAREILPAGGYVAKIVSAKAEETQYGDRLIVAFDIAEGEYAGFFKRDFDGNTNEDRKWRGTLRLSLPTDDGTEIDGWRVRSMNNFAGALEESNDGYTWDWNETKLKGKLLGVLFRNKEWEMNGRTGWTTEACSSTSAQRIRDGKFKVPKDKPLANRTVVPSPAFAEVEDDGEVPF